MQLGRPCPGRSRLRHGSAGRFGRRAAIGAHALAMKSTTRHTRHTTERATTIVQLAASFAIFTLTAVLPAVAAAQPCGGSDGHWGMMGGNAGSVTWISVLISWLLGIAAIFALVAVAVYLLRRSKL